MHLIQFIYHALPIPSAFETLLCGPHIIHITIAYYLQYMYGWAALCVNSNRCFISTENCLAISTFHIRSIRKTSIVVCSGFIIDAIKSKPWQTQRYKRDEYGWSKRKIPQRWRNRVLHERVDQLGNFWVYNFGQIQSIWGEEREFHHQSYGKTYDFLKFFYLMVKNTNFSTKKSLFWLAQNKIWQKIVYFRI